MENTRHDDTELSFQKNDISLCLPTGTDFVVKDLDMKDGSWVMAQDLGDVSLLSCKRDNSFSQSQWAVAIMNHARHRGCRITLDIFSVLLAPSPVTYTFLEILLQIFIIGNNLSFLTSFMSSKAGNHYCLLPGQSPWDECGSLHLLSIVLSSQEIQVHISAIIKIASCFEVFLLSHHIQGLAFF